MRVVEGLSALAAARPTERATAVLIGVFDGVHLGHQRLLHELVELAAVLDAEPTVVTFQNHPDELLGGRAVEWIVSLPHRLRLLRRAGVERVLLLEFDQELRSMSARSFAERILVEGLGARGLLLGYDSALGKDREGTPAHMAELGARLGFEVREGSLFEVEGEPVSSTAIRDAIRRGDLPRAHRLLGRWPSAFGAVVRGDARGRTLGFPTANVVPQSLVLPPAGVYAVGVLHDGEAFSGVANLGRRPTFAGRGGGDDGDGDDGGADPGAAPATLEVHLLDFAGDLYGHHLEVSFLERLRDERRFAGPEDLKAQIESDVERARAVLSG